MPDLNELSIEQQHALHSAAVNLRREFDGTLGTEINPMAVRAMAEVGIDITGEFPKPWTDEIVQAADVVVTMGCGDACPLYPGKRYEDWELDDPSGLPLEAVRPIRDEIERRVRALLAELEVPAQWGGS